MLFTVQSLRTVIDHALQVFKYLVRLLLLGKALSIEDMADVLCLKDNEYHVEDYTTALHLLARAEVRMRLSAHISATDYNPPAEHTQRSETERVQKHLAPHIHPRRVSYIPF